MQELLRQNEMLKVDNDYIAKRTIELLEEVHFLKEVLYMIIMYKCDARALAFAAYICSDARNRKEDMN
jgi:hypothetical protein